MNKDREYIKGDDGFLYAMVVSSGVCQLDDVPIDGKISPWSKRNEKDGKRIVVIS